MLDLNTFAASIVGTPFLDKGRDRDGLDCWGCIVLAYREVYGIELLSLDGSYEHTKDAAALESVVKQEQASHWRQVDVPQPGDVVVLRVKSCHSHVGLVLNSREMLHAQEGTDATVERYDGALWSRRVADFWRHVSRS
jgi:cell wall-associated NlpC family hydrolase